ncbi:MAG: hypothetical protein ACYTGC_06315 [Planctomycetota bacterium]|jgi:hypothetical protein
MGRTEHGIGAAVLALTLVATPAPAGDEEQNLRGTVELTYRDVNQDGSVDKYNEDFDGLDSGLRLSHLDLEWFEVDSSVADYLRVEADGLGGDPYERATVRVGRRDTYDLRLTYRNQEYIYNLFKVVDDLDASTWNTERRFTDVALTFYPTDSIELFVDFQQVERDGTSQVMADVNTELYQLDSPLDQSVARYSVGGRFEIGSVDVLFRQMLRRYDYSLDNSTTDNPGLSGGANIASLDSYRRLQNDEGDSDLTTLTVSAPLGGRVHLTASVFGTLLGDETIESQVLLNAEGTSFRGVCAVSGDVCSGRSPCDLGIPGNFCIPDDYSVADGTSRADIDGDYLVLDADLSVRIRDDLDFHFQGRTLDRDVESTSLRDLDGNGVADDLEGTVNDDTPGSVTSVEYSLDTLTGLFDYAPSNRYRFRLGFRTISRELLREGFEFGTNDYRNTPFESDSDDTLIVGMVLDPLEWFRFEADYEAGDITQAFTAVAPMETDRVRARARFTPHPDLHVDVGYTGYDNSNLGSDFRVSDDCSVPGADIDSGCWNTHAEGTIYSARIWHRPTPDVDYWFSWTRSDVDRKVRIRFDTEEFFNSGENGDSIYDNLSTDLAGQVNIRWNDTWRLFFRARINDADGTDRITGATFSNTIDLSQDFSDAEVGLTYSFENGLYVGGRVRMFDHDDANDRLDYDGDIISVVVGYRF